MTDKFSPELMRGSLDLMVLSVLAEEPKYGYSLQQSLHTASRGMVEAKRQQLGYRVDQRRKFVSTPTVAGPLGELLTAIDRPCVIHTIR